MTIFNNEHRLSTNQIIKVIITQNNEFLHDSIRRNYMRMVKESKKEIVYENSECNFVFNCPVYINQRDCDQKI